MQTLFTELISECGGRHHDLVRSMCKKNTVCPLVVLGTHAARIPRKTKDTNKLASWLTSRKEAACEFAHDVPFPEAL